MKFLSVKTTQYLLSVLAILSMVGGRSGAAQLTIQDPNNLLTNADRQVLMTNIAAIPKNRIVGINSVLIAPPDPNIPPIVALGYKGNQLVLYYPQQEANQPYPFGSWLARGLGDYAYANLLTNQEKNTWAGKWSSLGPLLWFIDFKGNYSNWYQPFDKYIHQPSATPKDPEFVKDMQKFIFFGSLFANQNHQTSILEFKDNDTVLQPKMLTFEKTKDTLTIGDYVFTLKNGTLITQIKKDGKVIVGNLSIPIDPVTLQRIDRLGTACNVQPTPSAPTCGGVPEPPPAGNGCPATCQEASNSACAVNNFVGSCSTGFTGSCAPSGHVCTPAGFWSIYFTACCCPTPSAPTVLDGSTKPERPKYLIGDSPNRYVPLNAERAAHELKAAQSFKDSKESGVITPTDHNVEVGQ